MFGEKKPADAERKIPKDILRTIRDVRSSGAVPRPSEDPIWYVGRQTATPEERARIKAEMPSIDEIIENAYREEGIEPPERVELPPRNDTPPTAS